MFFFVCVDGGWMRRCVFVCALSIHENECLQCGLNCYTNRKRRGKGGEPGRDVN